MNMTWGFKEKKVQKLGHCPQFKDSIPFFILFPFSSSSTVSINGLNGDFESLCYALKMQFTLNVTTIIVVVYP